VRYSSLFPVLRGEGWGEGRAMLDVDETFDDRTNARPVVQRFADVTRTLPLSPALPRSTGERE